MLILYVKKKGSSFLIEPSTLVTYFCVENYDKLRD